MKPNLISGESQLSLGSILSWIVAGAIGLGIPALSISLTYSFLINIGFLSTTIQKTGSPLISLFPGATIALICLGIGFYFVKTNSIKKHPLSNILFLIGTSGIAATIVSLWMQTLFLRQDFTVKQTSFNTKTWHNAGCGSSRVRQMMLTSMIQQIRGMTPQQVTALLGTTEVGEASYCLGPEPVAIPTDRLVLRVLYDAQGRAADVRISAN
jgi:hypothetical protein